MRTYLTLGIILMFIGTTIAPVFAQDSQRYQSASRGNWFYVGGDGPGNYTKIQDAIDNASPGDTVYVYKGTYHENVTINVTSLKLIGESRENTIINTSYSFRARATIIIKQSSIRISGFTIIGLNECINIPGASNHLTISHNNLKSGYCCVSFTSSAEKINNVVENNTFFNASTGIDLNDRDDFQRNYIRNNSFINNSIGILVGGSYNQIVHNRFISCRTYGVQLVGENTIVKENVFLGNDIGLEAESGYWSEDSKNIIFRNHFEDNKIGLILNKQFNTSVIQNNFIHNRKQASFHEESRSQENNWDSNYWGIPSYFFGQKCIVGWRITKIPRILQFFPGWTYYYQILWVHFDENPSKKPYEIPGMG